MKNLFTLALTFLFTILIVKPAATQTIEMSMVPDSISTLELDHTRIMLSDLDQGFISGNFNLQYKHVLNQKINLITEISYFSLSEQSFFTQNGFSNIYLGFQYKTSKKANVNSALNVGVLLPTAQEGLFSAFLYNGFDFLKFVDEATDLHVGYNSFYHFDNGLRIGFEVGSDLIIPITENAPDPELFGKYAFSTMYKATNGIYAQLELNGIALITEEGGFGDNSQHAYSIGLGYNGSKFGAGVYYRNFIDEDFSNAFNGILGFKFSLYL